MLFLVSASELCPQSPSDHEALLYVCLLEEHLASSLSYFAPAYHKSLSALSFRTMFLFGVQCVSNCFTDKLA